MNDRGDRPRRGYGKSDGFTTDRPRLPSVDAPNARPKPLASSPTTPSGSQPARPSLQPRPAPRRGGYSRGDGMTSDKPKLPNQDQSSAADLKPDRPEGLRAWGANLVDSSKKPPPKR